MLDPDVRFLLANERTLLAWIRTALSVMAIGLALTQLGSKSASQVTIGLLAVIAGAFMAGAGYLRFISADDSIRRGELPAIGNGPKLQVIAVIAFAVVVVLLEVPQLLK